MSIDYTDAEGVRHIQVSGRLDIPGAAAIDVPLTALAASQMMRVILDLEAVEFLSSIGTARWSATPRRSASEAASWSCTWVATRRCETHW